MDLSLNSLWHAPVSGSDSEAIISGAPLAYRSKCWDPSVRAITDMRCRRDEKVNWRSTPISYGIDWNQNQKIYVLCDELHFILWITPHEGASSTAIPISNILENITKHRFVSDTLIRKKVLIWTLLKRILHWVPFTMASVIASTWL